MTIVTASSIRARRHELVRNTESAEVFTSKGVNPAGSEDGQVVRPQHMQGVDPKKVAASKKAEQEGTPKVPARSASLKVWTVYLDGLETKPEGYTKDSTRDELADLVLGPKDAK